MFASYDKLFIGGAWVSPTSAARISVRNASTEEPIGEAPEAAEADVDAAVAAARSPRRCRSATPSTRPP